MLNRLELTRAQILKYRRNIQALDERLPMSPESLRQAAWAGLQDSMPRAAVLSIHARVAGTTPSSWEDPSLVQLWGPRFQLYVVAQPDLPLFSLGRMPDDAKGRRKAHDLAARLHAFLDGRTTLSYGQAGDGVGVHPNALRYAAATGTVVIRWAGARAPTIWTVPPPTVTAAEAREELARRYLHVYGPTTAGAFTRWAYIGSAQGGATFEALEPEMTPVRTPIGDAWILTSDEDAVRASAGPTAPARLLPSGDALFLVWGADRDLVAPNATEREALWTSRVWPGVVLVDGELSGTWRRDGTNVTVEPWRRLVRAEQDAVEAEAASLPLPDLRGPIVVRWSS